MDLTQRILFVDAETILLDKPAGLAVDSPRAGGDSLEERIGRGELNLGFHRPPVAMHRLDRDTSGCLLLARTPRARKVFQQAFEAKAVEKVYRAVLAGVPEAESGTIDLPLAKQSSREAGWRMVGDARGQPAVTRWQLLAVRDGLALVEFVPETGRTHQIRVHAREGLGCAVVGDPVYGQAGGAMLLHAFRLSVPRPPREPVTGEAPIPDNWPDWVREA